MRCVVQLCCFEGIRYGAVQPAGWSWAILWSFNRDPTSPKIACWCPYAIIHPKVMEGNVPEQSFSPVLCSWSACCSTSNWLDTDSRSTSFFWATRRSPHCTATGSSGPRNAATCDMPWMRILQLFQLEKVDLITYNTAIESSDWQKAFGFMLCAAVWVRWCQCESCGM